MQREYHLSIIKILESLSLYSAITYISTADRLCKVNRICSTQSHKISMLTLISQQAFQRKDSVPSARSRYHFP